MEMGEEDNFISITAEEYVETHKRISELETALHYYAGIIMHIPNNPLIKTDIFFEVMPEYKEK